MDAFDLSMIVIISILCFGLIFLVVYALDQKDIKNGVLNDYCPEGLTKGYTQHYCKGVPFVCSSDYSTCYNVPFKAESCHEEVVGVIGKGGHFETVCE